MCITHTILPFLGVFFHGFCLLSTETGFVSATSCRRCKRRFQAQAGETLERCFRVLDPWQTLQEQTKPALPPLKVSLQLIFPAQLLIRAPAQLPIARCGWRECKPWCNWCRAGSELAPESGEKQQVRLAGKQLLPSPPPGLLQLLTGERVCCCCCCCCPDTPAAAK